MPFSVRAFFLFHLHNHSDGSVFRDLTNPAVGEEPPSTAVVFSSSVTWLQFSALFCVCFIASSRFHKLSSTARACLTRGESRPAPFRIFPHFSPCGRCRPHPRFGLAFWMRNRRYCTVPWMRVGFPSSGPDSRGDNRLPFPPLLATPFFDPTNVCAARLSHFCSPTGADLIACGP